MRWTTAWIQFAVGSPSFSWAIRWALSQSPASARSTANEELELLRELAKPLFVDDFGQVVPEDPERVEAPFESFGHEARRVPAETQELRSLSVGISVCIQAEGSPLPLESRHRKRDGLRLLRVVSELIVRT